ncbi:MAG TPA: M56 family metallopeptidase [Thermoanaerobaculia bacterium]|jgi:beta-lactamase regulating signal transducer with metallopeptidase domain/tetratricopeptide (TPR) repeat protein
MRTLLELAARLHASGAAEALGMVLVKATVILLIARLLLAALPRVSAATRHAVGTLALIGVMALPLLMPVIPAWNVAVLRASDPPVAAVRADVPSVAGDESIDPNVAAADSTPIAAASQEPDGLRRYTRILGGTWKGLLVLMAIGGALLMIGQMIVGIFGVWSVARDAEVIDFDEALIALDDACNQLALRRDVRLLRSGRITVPVVWGFRQPVLLLPADSLAWPIERFRVVLLHELAHVKRLDGITLLATRLAVSLYWFHPLAWSLERAGRSACEHACDDLVLATGTKPSEYADHLLGLARALPSFDPFRSVTLAMSRRSQLEGRLISILQTDVRRGTFKVRGVAFACILAAMVVLPLSAVRLIAQPNEPKKQPSGTSLDVTPDIAAFFDEVTEGKGKDKLKFRFAPKTPADWYERATEYFGDEEWGPSIDAYKRAIDGGYKVDTATYNIACAYSLAGDKDRALEWLEKAIAAGFDDEQHIAKDDDLDPIRSDPRFVKIAGAAARVRLDQAVRRFQALRSERSADGHEWMSVGEELLNMRQLDEARYALEEAMRTEEKGPKAAYYLAATYALMGNADQALALARTAVEGGHNGDMSDSEFASVRSHPRYAETRRYFKELQMRGCCDPFRTKGDSNAARTWDDALAYHLEIARKYPEQGRAWFNVGFAAIEAQQYRQAIDAFEKALAANYRRGTSSYNLACSYSLAGNRDAAFEWLNRAIAAGMDVTDYMEDDDDLDNIRDDARWEPTSRAARAVSKKSRENWKHDE